MTSSVTGKVRKLARVLSTTRWRSALLLHHVAAAAEHAPVLCSLGDVRTVVDIGANRGQFALAARGCFPNARIVGFEPLPVPAKVFSAVFRGDARATLHRAAIGPRSGEALIHVSCRDDSSSLLPIGSKQTALFPGTAEKKTSVIRVARLGEYVSDETIESVALLKLDVQGFEAQALAGCEDVLDRFAWVYVECSFIELYEGQELADGVIAWLREREFYLRGVYNVITDSVGASVQADFLFARRRALQQSSG